MRVRDMKGLGPKTERILSEIGITSAERLRSADPFEIYARLKEHDPSTSLNFLYALIGAIEERHWRDIMLERKLEILLRLERMGLAPKK
jgi:DNA transformation protein